MILTKIKSDYNLSKKGKPHYLRVGFSLRKEIFFVAIGSIIGGITMHLPRILLDIGGTQYFVTLLVISKVVNSNIPEVGFLLHVFVATVIGIVTGVFLHKIIKFNVSKFSNGLIYGITAGIVVFVVFSIPVSQLLLGPNMVEVITQLDPTMTLVEASEIVKENFLVGLFESLITHLIWGLTVGVLTSLLTGKFGANYRCNICEIEFSKTSTFEKHVKRVHENPSDSTKHIMILGGGYSGVGTLKELQRIFENDVDVSISLVSQDNFFLHTPLLPEMATGTLASRHIATPIRAFCKRARYYQANVDSISLDNSKVTIKRLFDNTKHDLEYDYLVLALGGKTNFFGNKNLEKNSLTIKTLGDAIALRNHIISILERADQEENQHNVSKMMTFVVVGGGFSGVETVGEINDFVRESVEKFYRNIDPNAIRIVLISAGGRVLPEIGNLGEYVQKSFEKDGIEIIKNAKVVDASPDDVTLEGGTRIPCETLVWAGGVTIDSVISNLNSEHDTNGRLRVDSFLRLQNYPNVFALGDCASVLDTRTGKPYPPTAQHAVRQALIVSKNVVSSIREENTHRPFVYNSKGSMAKIGKRNGVALVLGIKVRGFLAWLIWRQYYLSTLPTTEKKFRVAIDWFADLFFSRDTTILGGIK